jgi:hypothetical protein
VYLFVVTPLTCNCDKIGCRLTEYFKIKIIKKVRPWLRRSAWTRSGGHWWITAGKKLRSEYLAWASPYFTFMKPEQLSLYHLLCDKSCQNILNGLIAKHLLPAGRYPQCPAKRGACRPGTQEFRKQLLKKVYKRNQNESIK